MAKKKKAKKSKYYEYVPHVVEGVVIRRNGMLASEIEHIKKAENERLKAIVKSAKAKMKADRKAERLERRRRRKEANKKVIIRFCTIK